MPSIEVTNLRKTYDETIAVDDVSLSVHNGEIFGILGPNGAGKTTTVESIAGLRVPDSGSISVLGLDPIADRDEVRQRLGVQRAIALAPPGWPPLFDRNQADPTPGSRTALL